MKLIISQNTGSTEEVSTELLNKLYDMVSNNELSNDSLLQGRLHATYTYEEVKNALQEAFPNLLYISALDYYVKFEDSEVVRVLTAKGIIPEGGGLTMAQAAFATGFRELFAHNTTVKNFDELRYFDKYKTTGGFLAQQIFDSAVNLESVDLTGIQSTGLYWAFRSCHSLEWYHGKNGPKNVLNLQWRNISGIDGYAFYENYGLHEVTSLGIVTILGDNCFQKCTNLTTIDISNITTIGTSTFEGDWNLEYFSGSDSTAGELNLPSLTGTLGNNAFKGCTKLTSVASLGSITSIGSDAFNGCTNLATINFPSTITSVNENAFNNTAWYNSQSDGPIIINNCILYKYKGIVSGTYTIPSNITKVSPSCFYGQSSLTGITSWPSSLNTIPKNCFQNSGLTSFDLTGIVSLDNNAFRNTKLTSILIPNSVTNLGLDTFSYCYNLTSVTIGTGVTSLGRNVFSYCTSLETLVIPANVQSLERDTLQGCSSLQWVRIESTTRISLNNSSCFNNTNNCEIQVPSNLVNDYKTASQWSNLASRIVAIPTT